MEGFDCAYADPDAIAYSGNDRNCHGIRDRGGDRVGCGFRDGGGFRDGSGDRKLRLFCSAAVPSAREGQIR